MTLPEVERVADEVAFELQEARETLKLRKVAFKGLLALGEEAALQALKAILVVGAQTALEELRS